MSGCGGKPQRHVLKKKEDKIIATTPGKKGYPKFKKRGRSVEYKQTGWKLAEDRKRITFTD
jgi:hypothetical protein